jgi:hypothetical protein
VALSRFGKTVYIILKESGSPGGSSLCGEFVDLLKYYTI